MEVKPCTQSFGTGTLVSNRKPSPDIRSGFTEVEIGIRTSGARSDEQEHFQKNLAALDEQLRVRGLGGEAWKRVDEHNSGWQEEGKERVAPRKSPVAPPFTLIPALTHPPNELTGATTRPLWGQHEENSGANETAYSENLRGIRPLDRCIAGSNMVGTDTCDAIGTRDLQNGSATTKGEGLNPSPHPRIARRVPHPRIGTEETRIEQKARQETRTHPSKSSNTWRSFSPIHGLLSAILSAGRRVSERRKKRNAPSLSATVELGTRMAVLLGGRGARCAGRGVDSARMQTGAGTRATQDSPARHQPNTFEDVDERGRSEDDAKPSAKGQWVEQQRRRFVTLEYGRTRARLGGRFDIEGEVRGAVGVLRMLHHGIGEISKLGLAIWKTARSLGRRRLRLRRGRRLCRKTGTAGKGVDGDGDGDGGEGEGEGGDDGDASGWEGSSVGSGGRPSFKQLPSQTLGPVEVKRRQDPRGGKIGIMQGGDVGGDHSEERAQVEEAEAQEDREMREETTVHGFKPDVAAGGLGGNDKTAVGASMRRRHRVLHPVVVLGRRRRRLREQGRLLWPGDNNNVSRSGTPANNGADGSDDDMPLAQRIPSALTAQRKIRRQVREEWDQQRRELAVRKGKRPGAGRRRCACGGWCIEPSGDNYDPNVERQHSDSSTQEYLHRWSQMTCVWANGKKIGPRDLQKRVSYSQKEKDWNNMKRMKRKTKEDARLGPQAAQRGQKCPRKRGGARTRAEDLEALGRGLPSHTEGRGFGFREHPLRAELKGRLCLEGRVLRSNRYTQARHVNHFHPSPMALLVGHIPSCDCERHGVEFAKSDLHPTRNPLVIERRGPPILREFDDGMGDFSDDGAVGPVGSLALNVTREIIRLTSDDTIRGREGREQDSETLRQGLNLEIAAMAIHEGHLRSKMGCWLQPAGQSSAVVRLLRLRFVQATAAFQRGLPSKWRANRKLGRQTKFHRACLLELGGGAISRWWGDQATEAVHEGLALEVARWSHTRTEFCKACLLELGGR
ncbi:hypothetical protein K438DRAFT_1758228 [Mycena galopus ATCC 62051]|nr:hypothetical protein K438DRAFT_1758228 [Mycena galopus ATCC 62051]